MKTLNLTLAATFLLAANVFAGSSSPVAGGAGAGGDVATVADSGPWELTAAGGLSLTSGNSDNLNYSLQLLASYLDETTELYIGGDYFYGESNDVTVQEALHGYVNYSRQISGNLGVNFVGDYLRNDPAMLDYRIQAVPGLTYAVYQSETSKLSLDGGVGYVWEKQSSSETDSWAWRIGQRFDTAVTASTSFYESVSFLQSFDNSDDWWATAEVGLKVALSDHWAAQTMVRYVYDHNPAVGAEEGDLAVMVGLSYSLAGFPNTPAAKVRRTLKPKKLPPVAAATGWSSSASLGFAMAAGNAENLLLTGDFSTANRTESNEFFFGIAGAYGEVGDVRSLQNLRSATQYNVNLNSMLYAGASLSFLADDVVDLDYRVTPAVLLGAHLVKSDAVALSVDVGPSYVFEHQGGQDDSYFALQAGERLSVQLTDSIRLGQALAFVPEAADFNNYLITASAFIEADITDAISLRTMATEIYDSTPAAGAQESDFILSAGIAVKF